MADSIKNSCISFWQQNKNICLAGLGITTFVGGIIGLLVAQYKGHIDIAAFAKTTKGTITFSAIAVTGIGCAIGGVYYGTKELKTEKDQKKFEYEEWLPVKGKVSDHSSSLEYNDSSGEERVIQFYPSIHLVAQLKNKIKNDSLHLGTKQTPTQISVQRSTGLIVGGQDTLEEVQDQERLDGSMRLFVTYSA